MSSSGSLDQASDLPANQLPTVALQDVIQQQPKVAYISAGIAVEPSKVGAPDDTKPESRYLFLDVQSNTLTYISANFCGPLASR